MRHFVILLSFICFAIDWIESLDFCNWFQSSIICVFSAKKLTEHLKVISIQCVYKAKTQDVTSSDHMWRKSFLIVIDKLILSHILYFLTAQITWYSSNSPSTFQRWNEKPWVLMNLNYITNLDGNITVYNFIYPRRQFSCAAPDIMSFNHLFHKSIH